MLIFNLTVDLVRESIGRYHVEAKKFTSHKRTPDIIRSEQILTEHGICYVSNNFLALELSAKCV